MGERELTSTLTILVTELNDTGEYVCQAELFPFFTEVDERTATLNVQGTIYDVDSNETD